VIVYEVTLWVQREVEDAFRDWLDGHVREILSLPGFRSATLFERLDAEDDAGTLVLCTHYRLRDQAALDDYLREHASRMRADGQARFGGRFRAERRVLQTLADY